MSRTVRHYESWRQWSNPGFSSRLERGLVPIPKRLVEPNGQVCGEVWSCQGKRLSKRNAHRSRRRILDNDSC